MAWAGGSRGEKRRTDSGRTLSGIISPPSSMEGRKMSCDHSTVARELPEITPMSAPRAPQVKAVSRVTSQKASQLDGGDALEERRAGEGDDGGDDQGVEDRGQHRDHQDGERRHAVDLEAAEDARLARLHQRAGQAQDRAAMTAKMTMAGTMLSRKSGLMPAITTPIMA